MALHVSQYIQTCHQVTHKSAVFVETGVMGTPVGRVLEPWRAAWSRMNCR